MNFKERVKKYAMINETNYWEKAIKNPNNDAYKIKDMLLDNKFALINVTKNDIYEVATKPNIKSIKEFPYGMGDKVVLVNIKSGEVVKKFDTDS